MALNSEDVVVKLSDGWLAVIVLNTVLHISELRGNNIRVRFNIASVSAGFIMKPGDTLSTNETIYVKQVGEGKAFQPATIAIERD